MKRSNSNKSSHNSQNTLALNSNISKSQKYHYNEYKAIFCPKCISLAIINITKENDDIFINITCEKDHKETMPLKIFLNNYQNYNIKECSQCQIKRHCNQLLYCFSCKDKICVKCKEEHIKKLNKKNTNEHIIERLVKKDRKCKIHLFKLNEYYCQTCKKYLCQECLKNAHINHNVINLYLNIDKIKDKLKTFISGQGDINNLQLNVFNKLVVKTKNCLEEKYNYDKIITNIKNNILLTYEMNKDNYYCVKNLNLIDKSFFNKNKYNSSFPKLAKEFGIINNENSKEENKNNKINEANENKDVNGDKKDVTRNYINYNEKENSKESNKINILNEDSFKSLTNNINLTQSKKNKIDNNMASNNQNYKENENQKINKNINNKPQPMQIDHMSYIDYDSDLQEIKKNNSNASSPPIFICDNNISLNKDNKEKVSQKNYCKIVQTVKKIRNLFCLSYNNFILSYDCNDNKSTAVYKIVPDEEEYLKMKHLKYINAIDEAFNHIEKYQDDILLFCSNKNILKIKIINHVKFDFLILFQYNLNHSSITQNDILQKESIFKLCLPLSNDNFIVSSIDCIKYWEKKINSLNQEPFSYNLDIININLNITSMKEIKDNLIVLIGFNNEGKYYLIYLEVDKNDNIRCTMKREISYEIKPDNYSIKKLTDDYFLILLKCNAFIVINTNTKEITSKHINNISSSFLYGETKVFENYFYNYVLEKNNENQLIFRQYKAKISDLSEKQFKFKYGKNLYINIKNKFNVVGLLFEKREDNDKTMNVSDNKTEELNVKVIFVAGDNFIMLFNYYP